MRYCLFAARKPIRLRSFVHRAAMFTVYAAACRNTTRLLSNAAAAANIPLQRSFALAASLIVYAMALNIIHRTKRARAALLQLGAELGAHIITLQRSGAAATANILLQRSFVLAARFIVYAAVLNIIHRTKGARAM
jgi:preprotein translocase subunit SecG